jgi:TPR repeat protein
VTSNAGLPPPVTTSSGIWYRRAADHGLAGAQFNLGIMYAEGQGVSQDYAVDARDRVASQNDAAADRRGAGIGI